MDFEFQEAVADPLSAPLHSGIVEHRQDTLTSNEHAAHTMWLAHFKVAILDESFQRTQANAERFRGFLPRIYGSWFDK
jgi:hypothetical protein